MNNIMKTIKKEVRHALPAMLFFFVIFSLADLTHILMHEEVKAASYSFLVIVAAAAVMGKVVIIADSLPFIGLFSKKPLIYSTIWKTTIYGICTILVRLLERILPLIIEGKSFSLIDQRIMEDVNRLPFWLEECWLFLLLGIFVAYQELIAAVGPEKVRKLFFGK